MAKIPKEILEKKVLSRAQRISMNRSPPNTIQEKKTSISGRTVIFADGTKMKFQTRESAYKAYKQARKQNGETF